MKYNQNSKLRSHSEFAIILDLEEKNPFLKEKDKFD
jgi:hypothetical protein